jgi:hypothetical protein
MTILVFLVGCTNTKVHLYTKYLSEEETYKITKELEKNKFTVIANKLSAPENINESTVIYAPFSVNMEHVHIVLETLSKLGWTDIQSENFVKGNHWYKKNNFGLILIPEGLIKGELQLNEALSQRYVGTDCETYVEIELHSNNIYTVKYKDGSRVITKKGSWKVTSYPYLELSVADGLMPMYFQAVKKTEQDIIGKVNVIEIEPLQSYQIFSNCKFRHGVRS